MTANFDSAITAVSSFGATVLGWKFSILGSAMVADATTTPVPDWLQPIIGPMGTLVALVIALKWMTGRLAKQEEKYDQREAERDEDRRRVIQVLVDNTIAKREISATMTEICAAVEKCSEAVKRCPGGSGN